MIATVIVIASAHAVMAVPMFATRAVAALAEAVVDEARAAGYATMWLDTSVRQTEAQALYLSLGFEPAAPYYEMTPELAAWLVFLRKDLSASS